MKIIMHGATNRGSSNFGDFIYGESFYKFIKDLNEENECIFFQPSTYFIKYIEGYISKKVRIKEADLILYLPGGYFGEHHNTSFKGNIIQFLRFMPLGLIARILGKKIAIIGVGAGPIKSLFLKVPISIIGKKANKIVVRDKESYDALKKIGIKNVVQAFDPILSLPISKLKKITEQVKRIKEKAEKEKKKIIFVHYNHSEEALEKFAKAVELFVNRNPEYLIVVGSDSINKKEDELYKRFLEEINLEVVHYIYDCPYEFIGMLSSVDILLTCKLHAGVVATQFNKSVVCIAEHPEKTIRYYKHINEKNRCYSLYTTDYIKINNLLEEYKTKEINIPESIIEESKLNFKYLKEVVCQKNEQ